MTTTRTDDRRQACCADWDDLGSWIDAALTHYFLSGAALPDIRFNFCPWCGADRRQQPPVND